MDENQKELIRLIDAIKYIDNDQYNVWVEKYGKESADKFLEKYKVENIRALQSIESLLKSGVNLNFVTINGYSPMMCAITQNNVSLIKLLIKFGISIHGDSTYTPLHRAAEFGADRVVKFLIEEKGLNPRKKSHSDLSIVSIARSSRWSRKVLPYLIETMKKTKGERLPPPKKMYELTEENVYKYLPQISISEKATKKLSEIIESLFIEQYSTAISTFYETIEEQDEELIFACIELITKASTSQPKDKVVKKITPKQYVHHGDLMVTGDLKIYSLMVTGNLTVKGNASNVEGRKLFVGGNFECENMYTEGPVVIGGNLKAKKIEAMYNDYSLEVRNTLLADTLIVDRHNIKAKSIEVKEHIEKNI